MKMYRSFISILESPYFIPGVALLGIVLRVALIYYTASHHNPTFADEDDYQSIGASLSHGGPYSIDGIHPSAFRAPGQSWLIACVFRVFRPHAIYVKLIEALLLAIIPFACSFMGRSIGLSVAAANMGAALGGLHPAIAYASTTLYPTALTTFALMAGLYLSVLVLNGKTKGASIGAGLAFGLAASATTTFAPAGILVGVIIATQRRFRAAIVVAVLGTLPVIAWMARNEVAMGEFTIATNGELNLFLGANDLTTPMSGNNVHGLILAPFPTYMEVASENVYKAEALAWIKMHPLKWARLVVLRGILVFDSIGFPSTAGLHTGLAAHVIGWILLPLMILSVVGLCLSYKLPLAWLTMAVLSLVVLSSALTITKPRFRFPCDPALFVFSIVGATTLWERRRSAAVESAQRAVARESQPA